MQLVPKVKKHFLLWREDEKKLLKINLLIRKKLLKKLKISIKELPPNQVITEQLSQKTKDKVAFSDRVSWLQPPLPAKTAALLIIVVPLILGLIDVLLTGRVGIITSFAYSITLLYLAATIDMRNAWDPVIAGPIAYFFVALILGQLTLSPTGSFLLKQSAMILTTLAFNAPWMIGSTALAFAIVFLRVRRSA